MDCSTQASLSFTVSWGLRKLMSIESVILSNHLILCYPLLLLPSVFPSIRIFPMRWLFASGGQSIRASASVSVLPMNIQDWSPLGWTVLISLQSRGLSRVFFNTTVQKHQFFGTQAYIFQGLKLCSICYQLYGLGSLPNSSVPQFSHPESGEKDSYTTSCSAAVRIHESVSTKGSEQRLASCRYWVLAIISSPEYPAMLRRCIGLHDLIGQTSDWQYHILISCMKKTQIMSWVYFFF